LFICCLNYASKEDSKDIAGCFEFIACLNLQKYSRFASA